ncbi:hypothetical protein TWF281_008601 [Arthrobotrys megalospora]
MHLANFLPVICLATSVASLAAPTSNDGAGVAEHYKAAKRDESFWQAGTSNNIKQTSEEVPGSVSSALTEDPGVVKVDATRSRWPSNVFGGPGPAIVDPETIPALPVSGSPEYVNVNGVNPPVRKNRRSRRDSTGVHGPNPEPLPDTLAVPLEQMAQWMNQLDGLLYDRAVRRAHLGNPAAHILESRDQESAPVPEKLKKRIDGDVATAWFNVGGGSPNDFRLWHFPTKSDEGDTVSSGDMQVNVIRPVNLNYKDKRDETGTESKLLLIEKRARALSDILAALNDKEDRSKIDTEDGTTLSRRAPDNSGPVDAKSVQEEVIHRIFKFNKAKKQKRGIESRQSSPEEVSRQILQNLFRFEDNENWKRDASPNQQSSHKRGAEWPDVLDKLREPTFPPYDGELKRRTHRGGISTDEFDDRVRTDDQNPSNYAWPDISLKVREALPKEADEISQRIIVTIFRMQENFRHKRSVDVEHEVKKAPVVERRADNRMAVWLGELIRRAGAMRLCLSRPRVERDLQPSPAKIKRRTRYSTTPPPVLPYEKNNPHNAKWKLECLRTKTCVLPWDIRRLQGSTGILRRIVDSIDPNSPDESQIIKRDLASDLLLWLDGINEYFEANRSGYIASGGQPTFASNPAGPEGDGSKAGGLSRRNIDHDLDLLSFDSGALRRLITKLRKYRKAGIISDSVYKSTLRMIYRVLHKFSKEKTKREVNSGVSGLFNTIKLAIRNTVSVPGFVTAFLKKRYDLSEYPWWSGGSEGDDSSGNPWGRGPSCLRLRTSNGCGEGNPYKRSVGSPWAEGKVRGMDRRSLEATKDKLADLRKRIEEDEKNVKRVQGTDDGLVKRGKKKEGNKEKKKQKVGSATPAGLKDPEFLRLNPFDYWNRARLV